MVCRLRWSALGKKLRLGESVTEGDCIASLQCYRHLLVQICCLERLVIIIIIIIIILFLLFLPTSTEPAGLKIIIIIIIIIIKQKSNASGTNKIFSVFCHCSILRTLSLVISINIIIITIITTIGFSI